MNRVLIRFARDVFLLAFAFAAPAHTDPPRLPVPAVDQRGYFYVGEPGRKSCRAMWRLSPSKARNTPTCSCSSTVPTRPPPTGWARPTATGAGPIISSSIHHLHNQPAPCVAAPHLNSPFARSRGRSARSGSAKTPRIGTLSGSTISMAYQRDQLSRLFAPLTPHVDITGLPTPQGHGFGMLEM